MTAVKRSSPDNRALVSKVRHLIKFVAVTQKFISSIDGKAFRLRSNIKPIKILEKTAVHQQSVRSAGATHIESAITDSNRAIWNQFVQETLDFRCKFKKSCYIVEDLSELLKKVAIKVPANVRECESSRAHTSSRQKSLVDLAFAKFGINATLIREAKPDGVTFDSFNELNTKLDNLIKERLFRNCGTMANRAEIMDEVHKVEVEIQALTVAEILGIIGAVASIIKLIVELAIDASDDNIARDTINASTCEELAGLTSADIDNYIFELLEGVTGDKDEEAIIRLLRCLGAERVREDIWPRWGDQILDNFHGNERDTLRALITGYGILNFEEMDDNATREFINNADSATLNSLSILDIRQLILNLFEGVTGDRDERAIIRLISSLPCDRVQELLSMPNVSYEDFDDNFSGNEWRDLRDIFASCGI